MYSNHFILFSILLYHIRFILLTGCGMRGSIEGGRWYSSTGKDTMVPGAVVLSYQVGFWSALFLMGSFSWNIFLFCSLDFDKVMLNFSHLLQNYLNLLMHPSLEGAWIWTSSTSHTTPLRPMWQSWILLCKTSSELGLLWQVYR